MAIDLQGEKSLDSFPLIEQDVGGLNLCHVLCRFSTAVSLRVQCYAMLGTTLFINTPLFLMAFCFSTPSPAVTEPLEEVI